MLRNFRVSQILKSKLIIPAILVFGILMLLIFNDIIYHRKNLYAFEQQLFQTGKAYEFEVKTELAQHYSIAGLMSVTLSKNLSDNDFLSRTESLLYAMMEKNNHLLALSLYLEKTNENNNDSTLLTDDSTQISRISLYKTKNTIVTEKNVSENTALLTTVELKKVILKDETKILSPVLKRFENEDIPVVPIVSSIYKGKMFVGYVLLYVSIDWDTPAGQFQGEYEAFVTSGNRQMIAIKDKSVFLTDKIRNLCFSCDNLLNEQGTAFNSDYKDSYLTLCFPMKTEQILDQWNICLRSNISQADISGLSRVLLWIIGFVVMFLSLFLIRLCIKQVEKPWEELDLIANGILTGNLDPENKDIEEGRQSDSKTKKSLLLIAKSLKELTNINKSIASGDYDKKFNIPGFKNQLLESSKMLYHQLETSNKKLNDSVLELKSEKKFTEGLGKIAGVLKLYHKDLNELSDQVIRTLVDLMDVAMGAIFLIKSDDESTWLEQEVSYAYNERKFIKNKIKMGETLVGACAAEKRTVHLKKIPEDYLKIISGLGQASPQSLLIVPLVFEDEVLGAIELGTLKEFDENSIRFVESAAENISSTLSLAQNNVSNSVLLNKTQQQTKELELRDRKMKETLAELKDIQTKTAQSEAEVRAKLDAMNNTLMMVEYTTDGILLDANYKFLNTMHYSLDEIKGNNVLDLLKKEDRDDLSKVMNMVKNGNFYEAVMHRHTKLGQEKWFLASYTPVFNDEGTVQSILFFGIDISSIRTNEEKLKEKVEQLNLELEKLKDNTAK